jgi:hypothetical protein
MLLHYNNSSIQTMVNLTQNCKLNTLGVAVAPFSLQDCHGNAAYLYPLPLNTKIYCTQGGNISLGLWPREMLN